MIDTLIQGILLGGYYAVIACGLSFMFSVMRIINLAHGSLAVASGYGLWLLASRFGIPPFAGLLIVLPVMAAVGWLLQRYLLERSARGGALLPILTTFGLAIVIDNLLFEQFGADTRSLAPFIGSLSYDSWELPGGIYVGKLAVLMMATAIALLGGLQLFLSHFALGRAIRATAEDPDTAGLVGIDAAQASMQSPPAIAMVTVGIAGAFLGMRATFDPYSGGPQLLFAFEAAVIGGAGSLWGTLIGGIVLGLAQSLGAQLHPQGFLIGGHVAFLLALFARLFLTGIPVVGGPPRQDPPSAAEAQHERLSPRHLRSNAGRRSSRLAVSAIGARSSASSPSRRSSSAPVRVDRLTALFVYVILAAMWNALAGFGGLVSVGQQVFFGLGAYFTIRLADAGLEPVRLAALPPPSSSALISLPLSLFMLRLKGGEFAIGMWVISGLTHMLVNLDRLIQGETGTSLISLNAYDSGTRRAVIYWLALASMAALLGILFALLRSRTGAAIQAIRDNEDAAASVGVRVIGTKRLLFVLAAFGIAVAGGAVAGTSPRPSSRRPISVCSGPPT